MGDSKSLQDKPVSAAIFFLRKVENLSYQRMSSQILADSWELPAKPLNRIYNFLTQGPVVSALESVVAPPSLVVNAASACSRMNFVRVDHDRKRV